MAALLRSWESGGRYVKSRRASVQWVCAAAEILVLATGIIVLPAASEAQTLVATVPVGPQPAITEPSQALLNPANNKLYVSGDFGAIAVIDAATNTTITHIGVPGAVRLVLNPRANLLYATNGGAIYTIDSTTDTVLQSVQPPPSTDYFVNGVAVGGLFGDLTYNPTTNKLYVVQSKLVPFGLNAVWAREFVLRDPITLAELSVVASEPFGAPGCGSSAVTDPPQIPSFILFNSATNKYYGVAGVAGPGLGCANTWLFVVDATTDAVIATTHVVSNQLTYFIPGSWSRDR